MPLGANLRCRLTDEQRALVRQQRDRGFVLSACTGGPDRQVHGPRRQVFATLSSTFGVLNAADTNRAAMH